jgi:pimeloyl-ACP methyl ester carboxylesterase
VGARLAWLLLASVLCAPALDGAWRVVTTAAFLAEFLSAGRWPALSALTETPASRPLAPGLDLHVPRRVVPPAGLVLVHGVAPRGKDEPSLVGAALLLARTGWAVAVPTVDGLTQLRLRPDDAGPVSRAVAALRDAGYTPVSILAVSVGGGPALLAASDPVIARDVKAVLLLGGYASARELLRYALTGAYRFGNVAGRRETDREAVGRFARANAELLDAGAERLLDNRDPAAVDALLEALPPSTKRLLDELSPGGRLGGVRARLYVIHGRDDPAVPYTEALRLLEAARRAGRPARGVIVGALGHVDPAERAGAMDLLRLGAAFHAFRSNAR